MKPKPERQTEKPEDLRITVAPDVIMGRLIGPVPRGRVVPSTPITRDVDPRGLTITRVKPAAAPKKGKRKK